MKINKNLMVFAIGSMIIVSSSSPVFAGNNVYLKSEPESNLIKSELLCDEVSYDKNKNLSDIEIFERLQEINNKYDLYESFSCEDSEFIIKYSDQIKNMNQIQSRDLNQTFKLKEVKDSKHGVTAKMSGTVFQNTTGIHMENKFGGDIDVNIVGGASKVESVSIEIEHVAYGVVGSDGIIGKVYEKSIKYTKSNPPFASINLTDSKIYTAVVISCATSVKSEISTEQGRFSLYGTN